MVFNIVLSVVVTIALLYVVATLVRAIGGNSMATIIAQFVAVGLFAGALVYTNSISLLVAGALLSLVIAIRIFAFVWFWHIGRKMMDGKYGKETQWAVELTKEDDMEFMKASAQLPQEELREVGIIAESKEELREKTIERADE